MYRFLLTSAAAFFALPLCLVVLASAQEKAAKPLQIPYRLTDAQHVMVRLKINGQGPFHFIVDTGAPFMFVATSVGKKLGLQADERGWAMLDQLEIEGGAVQTKVKCRVETPFQLVGMNSMGMAGVELHGILGYTVLAPYKMEFDFTRTKMTWTPLAFTPPQPELIGGKGGAGGLDFLGTIMRFMGLLTGAKTEQERTPRGFVGIELAEDNGQVAIKAVLEKSPAADAGLKPGDRILELQGRTVSAFADVQRLTANVQVGQAIRFKVRRDGKDQEITVTTGGGL